MLQHCTYYIGQLIQLYHVSHTELYHISLHCVISHQSTVYAEGMLRVARTALSDVRSTVAVSPSVFVIVIDIDTVGVTVSVSVLSAEGAGIENTISPMFTTSIRIMDELDWIRFSSSG